MVEALCNPTSPLLCDGFSCVCVRECVRAEERQKARERARARAKERERARERARERESERERTAEDNATCSAPGLVNLAVACTYRRERKRERYKP